MPDFTTAIDEPGGNKAFNLAIAAVPPQTGGGSTSLGPFTAGYSTQATFQGNGVDYIVQTQAIRIVKFRMNWKITLSLTINLGQIFPPICFPQICIKIWKWKICTPGWCVYWPTFGIQVPYGDFLQVSADFRPQVQLVGGVWQVKAKLLQIPNLQFGAPSALLLAAIGAALVPALLAIPFIGWILGAAVATILALIGIGGLTGLLGSALTPFVAGFEFLVWQRHQTFQILPHQSAIDPAVNVVLNELRAYIAHDEEDELIVVGGIA